MKEAISVEIWGMLPNGDFTHRVFCIEHALSLADFLNTAEAVEFLSTVFAAHDEEASTQNTPIQNISNKSIKLQKVYASLGVYGHKVKNPEAYILAPYDRIELYLPLKADPKLIRRKRAEQYPVGRYKGLRTLRRFGQDVLS